MTVERDEGFRAGELLPCPFCGGGEADLYRLAMSNIWFVACDDCGAQTNEFANGKADAVKAWNTRALLPANAGQADGGVKTLPWVIAEAKRIGLIMANCAEINSTELRHWRETIEWLEQLA